MRGLLVCALSVCLTGCAAAAAGPTISEFDLSEFRATVALSASQLDRPDEPAPIKPPRKDCKVCNGTGKVRSGDGLHVFDCTACLAPAVNLSELPKSSRADEVAFGEPERTLKTRQLCPCETTGLCTCGLNCPCVSERTGVAWLYTTDNCPACDREKDVLRRAFADGKLPKTLRVIVTSEAPKWVTQFPTFHWSMPGSRVGKQSAKAQTLIDEYNPRPSSGLAPQATPSYVGPAYHFQPSYSTCGPGGCSTGAFYGSSCSGGSCGVGFSVGRGGFRGFSGGCSGGGCSSCR